MGLTKKDFVKIAEILNKIDKKKGFEDKQMAIVDITCEFMKTFKSEKEFNMVEFVEVVCKD